MISDFIHWLLATFLIAPLQAEIDTKLKTANASRAAYEQVRTCMADATPRLIQKANGDWLWAAKTVTRVATGLSQPEEVLAEEVPACRPAIDVIRPLMREGVS